MSIVENPSSDDIDKFLDFVRKHLLEAYKRGSRIKLGAEVITTEIFTPEYGKAPMDLIYTGMKFLIEFKER